MDEEVNIYLYGNTICRGDGLRTISVSRFVVRFAKALCIDMVSVAMLLL